MEGSLAAASVAVVGRMGSLVLLVRQPVRRGRMHGCRRASRSGLLIAPGARSFGVGRRGRGLGLGRCRRLMEGRVGVLGSVAGTVRWVGP